MKKVAFITLLSFAFVLLAGCVVAGPTVAPPPTKVIARPAKPGPNHVWISGHWKWTGSKYVWVSGHWTKARPGRVWVPGHWEKRGQCWVWRRGHWKRV